jgi:DNA polymerase-1
MMKFDPAKTLYLIDGSSFLYRSYYGLRPLHTSKGAPVQAVYSFCRMIKKLYNQFNPEYMAIVWDSKGKTIRHEIYQEYKATRQEAPSDLFFQKERIQEFARLIALNQVEKPGVEADDLMYSIVQEFKDSGLTTVLITSDKDMGQVLDNDVVIYDPFKEAVIDETAFTQKMGFGPDKLPFYFALVGDASDNIPGVTGIGQKGATELVKQFASLQDLYNNLDKIKEKTRQQLEFDRTNAFLSEQLFKLRYVELNSLLHLFKVETNQWINARPLFEELEFKSLVKELQAEDPAARILLSQAKGYQFITVQTPEQLDEVTKQIKEKKLLAIDTELNGLGMHAKTIGISICVQKGISYYIPFGHQVAEPQLPQQTVIEALKPLLEDPQIKKVMQASKFDRHALAQLSINTQGVIFDTLIAAHLVTEDWQRIGLKYLSKHYLNEPMLSFSEVVTDRGYKSFDFVPFALATEYAASDAHQTLQLYPILVEELRKHSMYDLYMNIEHPLVDVLFAMEKEGIILDTAVLKKIDVSVSAELTRLRNEITALVGDEFKEVNLNSPKQLARLLFVHLQLPTQKKTSGKTTYSTDQEVLFTLAKIHPVPGLIAKYRELFKIKSTYIDPLPEYINPIDKRIHTNFTQTQVATGRLASSEPNLQNIPVDSYAIRSAFIPPEGFRFISADYSQIELRVLAQLSQDPVLIDAFKHNIDIHLQTAAKLFDLPLDRITNEQRQFGKRINFSILYGLTPFGLSKDLDIPFNKAKEYIDKYFAQFPRVQQWMQQVIEETKEHGYVITHWGRRRYLPGIYERNKNLYDLACRIAINTKAQGTAAELMKLAMIKLDKIVKEKNLPAKMILQIHDELLLTTPVDQQEQTGQLVKNLLETIVDWLVPLQVSLRYGKNWQEVTK